MIVTTPVKTRLLVDAWNVFEAGYVSSEAVTRTGKPVGGVLHALHIISRLAKEHTASSVDIVWETGPSRRRTEIYRFYKGGSTHMRRLNRSYDESVEERVNNILWQVRWLTQLLGMAGHNMYHVDNLEARDIIGHLVAHNYRDDKVVILSGDNSLWQLLRGDAVISVNNAGNVMTEEGLIEKYSVHPSSWTLARSMLGNKSDQMDGVKGVGDKRVASIDLLLNPEPATLEAVWEWLRDRNQERLDAKRKPLVWMTTLLDERIQRLVQRNYKLSTLIDLNAFHYETLQYQSSQQPELWQDAMAWMRELNLEGISALHLWDSLSCSWSLNKGDCDKAARE